MRKFKIVLAVSFCLLPALQVRASAPYVAAEYRLSVRWWPPAYVAAANDDAGDVLAVFIWKTFEGEPYAGTVVFMRGEAPPLELSGVWSAAVDERWERVAVGEEVEVIDNTVEPPFARTNSLCRQLDMNAATLAAALYYDGFAGNGYVTRPVVYGLDSGAREALPVAGGDFIDWAGASRLVIGREVGGSKMPTASALELYGYNLESGSLTFLASREEFLAKLGPKLSADVRDSPYLPAAWRLVPTPDEEANRPAIKIAAPARNGFFENGDGGFFWRSEGGESTFIGEGVVVAASGDGSWVVTLAGGEGVRAVAARRLAWR
ncbi:MAG: hypothetical protein GTN49_04790 [candidate division Zixibacteria bacterium]|nr:hypothetical protein [candidate division Zixibacteria bacterium]